jgi:hypothetical protein
MCILPKQTGKGIAANKFSSTERELYGYLYALETWCCSEAGNNARTQVVQLWGDNKGAISVASSMKGGITTFPVVARIHLLAVRENINVSFIWALQTDVKLRLADEFSKRIDEWDWRLSRKLLQQQVGTTTTKEGIQHQGRAAWPLQVDLFTSDLASICPVYIAEHLDRTCAGVNSLHMAWNDLPSGLGRERPICYAVPLYPSYHWF